MKGKHEEAENLSAIDEAEDEWGQHDMRTVIPTSGNLRMLSPRTFPTSMLSLVWTEVLSMLLNDDSNFSSSFGLNVVRGMLRFPAETMHNHQRRESAEKQKQAFATFVQEWAPFDWTRVLD